MAIRSYNPATRTAGTTADALERLRNLEIVSRFDGATIADASNTVLGSTDNFVTISANRNVSTVGVHAVIGKTIFIDGNVTLAANAAGVHFQFFNCSVIYRPTGTNGTTTPPIGTGQNLNSDAIDSRASQGAASTRSVSFYGCSFTVAPTAPANIFLQFGDVMNSTLQWGGGLHTPLPCFNVGTRAINFTLLTENVSNTSVLEVYGAPEISEGLVIRNHSIEITGTGAGGATETYQQLYTSPDFTGPGNQQRWRTQDSAQGQSAFQVIGPFNPFNNVLNDTRRTAASDNGVQTFAHLRNNTGQVLNYYGWEPGFFADLAQEEPIQNVNARLRTSASLTNTAINGTGGQTSMLTAISNTGSGYNNQSASNKNSQVIYKSDANGLLVADNTAQYSTNGTTFTTGWIDFLRLRPYNETGATTGGNELGVTWFNQSAPDNTIFAPIAQVTGGAYTQYETDIDYRSYSHNVDFAETQNGVIGTAAGNQASSTLSPIDESKTIASVNSRIKTTNVDADNLPDLAFNGTTPASLQDISNAVRSAWYQYEFDPHYDSGDATFPDAGPFNENTYPLNIVLSATAPTVADNITFAEDGYGIGLVGNILEVAVHTNTLGSLSGDILNNDPSNIQSITIGGRNIDGVTYNGTTIGNFGAMTNSNITTTNTDPQSVTSISGSTLHSAGQITISNTTVNSNITATAGNVLLNNNINAGANDSGGSATASDNVSCENSTINNFTMTSMGTGDVTLTGSTIDNLTVTSADNINLTNATVTGSNFNAADNINASGVAQVISSSVLQSDNINNTNSTRLGDGNTYGATGRTMAINFTGLSGTVDAIDLLSAGGGYSTVGTINLSSDAAVRIEVTQDDVDKLNLPGIQQGVDFPVGNITYIFPLVSVSIPVTVQQSAVFGTENVNFDGYITVVENTSGTRAIVAGPTKVTDSNRSDTFYTTNNIALGSKTLEVYTTGDKWAVSQTTVDNTSMGVTGTIIADGLYQRGVTTTGTIDSVVVDASNNLTITTSGFTDTGVDKANAFVGRFRDHDNYATAIARSGSTVDLVTFVSTNAIPPTVNSDRITGDVGDGALSSFAGISFSGSGTVAATSSVTTVVWQVGAAPIGAQPSAIRAEVQDVVDEATNELKQNQSNLKESVESNPYVDPSSLPFNTSS